jgi:aspartate aminotransferase-like enzyme
MIVFSVAHPEPRRLQAELRDRYRIEIPVFSVDGVSTMRISVQAYAREEHCERLIDALGELLRQTGRVADD